MADAVALLQELIRFDTVNPPGNERAAQEHLAGLLEGAGLEVELVGSAPERPNLVAPAAGTGGGPTLACLSHVDTVLAAADEWTHDPWSGDVADGFVWGRGAIDMKSQTAAEVAAVLRLAAEGWRGVRRPAADRARRRGDRRRRGRAVDLRRASRAGSLPTTSSTRAPAR